MYVDSAEESVKPLVQFPPSLSTNLSIIERVNSRAYMLDKMFWNILKIYPQFSQ